MKANNIARKLDDIIFEDKYIILMSKVEGVSRVLIKDDSGEIEFQKVGAKYSASINGESHMISQSEFESILSPYIGKRIFISL